MAKFDSFLSELESASVLELNELVKAIEEKFGVSAAAVASAPAAGGAAGDRKSTRLNSSHSDRSRMPSSA